MTSLSKRAAGAWLIMTLALAPHSGGADELRIYAAGSLTAAFTEMVNAFPAPPGSMIEQPAASAHDSLRTAVRWLQAIRLGPRDGRGSVPGLHGGQGCHSRAVNVPGAGGDPLPAPAGLNAGFPATVAR